MNSISRPALGQKAAMGTLYDARRERFLPDVLFQDIGIVTSSLLSKKIQTTSITSSSLTEKVSKFGMNDELTASFLAGMVNTQGSARYLNQKPNSLPTVHRALLYTIVTRQDSLNFMHPNVKDQLDFGVLEKCNATHVVIGITWGARTVISATHRLAPGTDREKYEASLKESMKTLEESSEDGLNGKGLGHYYRRWEDFNDTPLVKVFSDVSDSNDDPPEDLESAFRDARRLSTRVEEDKDARSKPLTYTLLPIASLVMLGAVILEDVSVGQLSPECFEKYINLVNDLTIAQQLLNLHYQTLKLNRSLVESGHFAEVENLLRASENAESDLNSQYSQSLEAVRTGRSSSRKTLQIVEEFMAGDTSPDKLMAAMKGYGGKLKFISMAVELGAEFIGDSKRSLQQILRSHSRNSENTYVFFFNSAVMEDDKSWDENVNLLRDLLKDRKSRSALLLIDCDVTGEKLDSSRISVFFQEAIVTKDLLKEKKVLADKHLLRYDDRYLEQAENSPSQRRALKMPCPGPDCGPDICQWICSTCHMSLEYGKSDDFCYCDCGKFPSNRMEFNCQGPNHGTDFERYQSNVLKKLLQSLPSPQELNILILGETGVGKSTFVNAFVNYLTFSSLDEGLSAKNLNWVIPCSFTTQVVDENDRLISKHVKIGSDIDENDGSRGQSATQQATVYPIYLGDTLIRLIDTPGIGDTRGMDHDAKNMKSMLSVLRNYPDLHGILILLKPNNARLGVMFRFCVKELLTHLHRSAAENMVFGFTNTRGSNYTPGDTFQPLEKLLSDYNDVIPGLFRNNVYCFDSESFRYLAARKDNIDIGNIDDYRRSWEQSTTEARRLLAHFQTLQPHHTQSTLSLNETRHLIAQLTAPMQQISAAITTSILDSEKQARDLSNTRLTGEALKAKLQIQKVTVNATQLPKPKTVCAHEKCVEAVSDTDGIQVLLRKNLCHNPCCLTNVPVGQVGTPELINCAAFDGDKCRLCAHHWKEHEHIVVEYGKSTQSVVDPKVRSELDDNGNIVKAKEAQIKALTRQIAELKNEHREIQEAAAKFSVYLKMNSITHYNDATVEYLEHLIKDEKTKVGAGISRVNLESLEKDLDQYKKFVAAMEEGQKSNSRARLLDEAGVAQLVQRLYNLPHYGAMLKNLAKVVGRAYEATFRERPYRIRGNTYWMADMHGRENHRRESRVLTIPRRPVAQQPVRSMLEFGDGTTKSPSKFFHLHSQSISNLRKNPFKSVSRNESTSSKAPSNWAENSQSEKPSKAVRSISQWEDDTTEYSENHTEVGTPSVTDFDSQTPPTSPPPYENPFDESPSTVDGGAHRGLNISQVKGVWGRMKNKLRK